MCKCCVCCSCSCQEEAYEIPVYTNLDNLEKLIVPREERIKKEREEKERRRAVIDEIERNRKERYSHYGKYLNGYGKIQEILLPFGEQEDELKVRVNDPKTKCDRYLAVKNGQIVEINSRDFYR